MHKLKHGHSQVPRLGPAWPREDLLVSSILDAQASKDRLPQMQHPPSPVRATQPKAPLAAAHICAKAAPRTAYASHRKWPPGLPSGGARALEPGSSKPPAPRAGLLGVPLHARPAFPTDSLLRIVNL